MKASNSKAEIIIQTGDGAERTLQSPAREIDRLLSELGHLYLLRTRASRFGDRVQMEEIAAQILLLKAKLADL